MKIEDYNEYYIQGSDHYLIPKDNFKELFNEMVNWKENAQEYKEVIDRAKEYIKNHKRNLINEITHEEYEVLDDENIINLLEILDNKGE